MEQPTLPLPIAAPTRRRGRPPGARNKRSSDLARYVEARFAGMTPGQQAAELAMVSAKELREAKAAAKHLGIPDLGASPLLLAMAVKAKQLASAIGCETREAWLLLQRERAELLPYVHQKLPQAADTKGKAPATVFIVPEGEAPQEQLPDFSAQGETDIEFVEDFDGPAQQVGQPKSDERA